MNFSFSPEGATQTRLVSAGSRDLVVTVLVFAVTLAFQLPFYDRWLAGMDEGHMALFAEIAATGGVLYRDATFYPLPGAFLFLAGLFKLFGPSLWLARITVALEFALFVSLIHLLLRRMVPRAAALCGVGMFLGYRVWVFPHWQIYSYSTTSLLIFLISGLLLLSFFQSRDRKRLLLSGLVYGIGVFCKQDYGAAVLLGCGLAMVVFTRTTPSAERPSGAAIGLGFVAPAGLVGALAGLFFWYQGTLADALQLTVFNHFIGMATYDYASFPPLLPLFQQDPILRKLPGLGLYTPGILFTADSQTFFASALFRKTAVIDTLIKTFFYGPYLFYSVGALRLWRGRTRFGVSGDRTAALAELLLWGIGAGFVLLITLNRPQDFVHLAVLYWPIGCLVVVYSHAFLCKRKARTRIAAVVAVGLMLAPVAYYSLRLAWLLRVTHSEAIPSERAGTYVTPTQAGVIGDVLDYIAANTERDDAVAVMPYFPAIHFLADRRGPQRSSYIIWPFPEFPDRDERIIEAMEATETKVVIYHFNQFLDFPRVATYAPELFDYLVDHFEIEHFYSRKLIGMSMAAALRTSHSLDRRFIPESLDGLALEIESRKGVRAAVSEIQREDFVRRDRWPLRRVIALRPSARGARSVLSVPLEPRPGEHLHTSIGVRPDFWASPRPSWVTFSITAKAEGQAELLFEQRLDPQRHFADRSWFDVDIDLSRYAGKPIVLEFATATQAPSGERIEMAGFGEPHLVGPTHRSTNRETLGAPANPRLGSPRM